MVPKADASAPAETAPGYWCVVCGRWLPADAFGVIVHDAVEHPEFMRFDDEARPQ